MLTKYTSTLAVVLVVVFSAAAQQQVNFTQYMFNGTAINPGYIGSHESLSISALSRWQWVGFEGAPTTQTLSVHSPVPRRNISFGLQFVRDQVGFTTNNYFMLGGSYRIKVSSGFLSMGLQGGLQVYNESNSDAYVQTASQDRFTNFSSTIPNFGYGLFYYSPRFYVGLSSPLALTSTIESSNGMNQFTQRQHYYGTAGLVFDISENVKMKPNFLVRLVEGAPISVDYNLNFLFNEILWVGVSVRPPESVSLLLELNVNQRFRVGYSYDHIIEGSINNLSASSHELLLNYRIKLIRDKIETPRYFQRTTYF